MMRVTSAGSCETILWSWLAVLLGSSTVAMILAVTSGSVAMLLTILTASRTRACGSARTAVDIGLLLVGCVPVAHGEKPAASRRIGLPPLYREPVPGT